MSNQMIFDGEKVQEFLESMGWDYAESSDGTGDKVLYWDDVTQDMPGWCSKNTTSCKTIEDVFGMLMDFLGIENQDAWAIEFK